MRPGIYGPIEVVDMYAWLPLKIERDYNESTWIWLTRYTALKDNQFSTVRFVRSGRTNYWFADVVLAGSKSLQKRLSTMYYNLSLKINSFGVKYNVKTRN